MHTLNEKYLGRKYARDSSKIVNVRLDRKMCSRLGYIYMLLRFFRLMVLLLCPGKCLALAMKTRGILGVPVCSVRSAIGFGRAPQPV